MASAPVYEPAALRCESDHECNGVAGRDLERRLRSRGHLKARAGYLEGRDGHVLRARVLQIEVAQTQLARLHAAEVDGSGGPLEPVHAGKTVNTGPTTTAATTIALMLFTSLSTRRLAE